MAGEIIRINFTKKIRELEIQHAKDEKNFLKEALKVRAEARANVAPLDVDEDFGERMKRIRASLERINQLMHELKVNSAKYRHGDY